MSLEQGKATECFIFIQSDGRNYICNDNVFTAYTSDQEASNDKLHFVKLWQSMSYFIITEVKHFLRQLECYKQKEGFSA